MDRLLRGGFTGEQELRQGKLSVPGRRLIAACIAMGATYGAAMGLYSATTQGSGWQLFAAMLKVPALFLLTLVVTFPSLYVFSALANSRLSGLKTAQLLLAAVAVNLAVLASFSPVTMFFTLSTDSYPFMILLNVLFLGIAGTVGLAFLHRTLTPILGGVLQRETSATPAANEPELEDDRRGPQRDASLAPAAARGRRVFTAWLLIYGVVGAQMGWILRPFIGSPELEFSWFRAKESHFFEAVLRHLGQLLS